LLGFELAGLVESFPHVGGVGVDLVSLIFPGVDDAGEHALEGGHAVALAGREVGSAIKRFAVGREENRHGPTAAAGQRHYGLHVNAIDVRPLLPIHFDADKVLVHDRGGGRILEGFVGHDMAPVAGGVTDAEEDRFVFGFGAGQHFRPPLMPVHRVVRVLKEIGGGGVNQSVGHFFVRSCSRVVDQAVTQSCADDCTTGKNLNTAPSMIE